MRVAEAPLPTEYWVAVSISLIIDDWNLEEKI